LKSKAYKKNVFKKCRSILENTDSLKFQEQKKGGKEPAHGFRSLPWAGYSATSL
jgi:hypothetical protein